MSKYEPEHPVQTLHTELFQRMSSGVAIYRAIADGADFEFVDVNAACERICRLARDQLVGQRLSKVLPGVAEFGVLEALTEVWRTGQPQTLPPARYQDEQLTLWVSNEIFRLPSGEVVAIFEDITHQQEITQQLQQQQHMLQTILDGIPDIIALQKPDHSIIAYNRTGYEFIQKTPAEVAGCKCYELIGRLTPCQPCASSKALASGEIETLERYIPELDRWVEARSIPIRDAAGNITVLVEQVRDITHQKHAEQQQQQLHQHLQQMQKLESLGLMAGGVAHDFNNLLVGMMGNIELVIDDLPPGSEQTEYLRDSLDAGRQMSNLAEQMLAFAGKGRFNPQPLDLSHLIEDLQPLLHTAIPRGIDLDYQLTHTLPAIEADSGQLRQIIINLIINAAEALNQQPGCISVATSTRWCDAAFLQNSRLPENCAPGHFVILKIRDSGCGMEPSVLRQMFDPFFTTKFSGRGLGLAAVLGIVRQHQGTVSVESSPGHGTTFQLLLPAAAETTATTQDFSSDNWRGCGTILLVDDEIHVRRVAERMLKRLGFEVIACPDSQDAIDLFQRHHDTLTAVIIDFNMPVLPGTEVFRRLRAINPDVPVFISSGYSRHLIDEELAHHAPAGFIPKPYRFGRLRHLLHQYFRHLPPI